LIDRQTQIAGKRVRLAADALECLARNPWPGNVRELANLLERLTILFPGHQVAADDLPARYRGTAAPNRAGGNVQIVVPREAPRELAPREFVQRELPLPEAAQLGAERGDAGRDVDDLIVAASCAADVAADYLLESALPSGGLDLKDHLNAIELGLIRQALEEADGTVAEAARLLRMRRTTLVEKLRKYRLSA